MLLKTSYLRHHYNGQQLSHLERQFLHIKYGGNEVDIITGILSLYSGGKLIKNQAEDLSIEYRTNISNDLEEAGKVP